VLSIHLYSFAAHPWELICYDQHYHHPPSSLIITGRRGVWGNNFCFFVFFFVLFFSFPLLNCYNFFLFILVMFLIVSLMSHMTRMKPYIDRARTKKKQKQKKLILTSRTLRVHLCSLIYFIYPFLSLSPSLFLYLSACKFNECRPGGDSSLLALLLSSPVVEPKSDTGTEHSVLIAFCR
jgi:hypothetical protein